MKMRLAAVSLCLLALVINYINGELLTDTRKCVGKLMSGNSGIPDSAITASSSKTGFEPVKGRLESTAAWEPDTTNNHVHWIQVNLQKPMKVSGVVVMGRADLNIHVPGFQLATSLDGKHFHFIRYHQYGVRMAFNGPNAPDWAAPRFFGGTLITQYVRLYPDPWQPTRVSLRFDVLGCTPTSKEVSQALKEAKPKRCKRPIGFESGAIEDSQFSASSVESTDHEAWHARLNFLGRAGIGNSWCPTPGSTEQWLQINFKKTTQVTGILVQGRETHVQYVKTFKIQYGDNGSSWKDLEGGKIFEGTVHQGVAKVMFPKRFTAQYVRFLPQTWEGLPCVRLEFFGCHKKGKPGKD